MTASAAQQAQTRRRSSSAAQQLERVQELQAQVADFEHKLRMAGRFEGRENGTVWSRRTSESRCRLAAWYW